MISIKEIAAKETYPVRHRVLRPGQPVESCHFDADDKAETIHYGLFEQGKLAAVATITTNKHPAFSAKDQYQLRGMAVLDEHQQKGFGAKLLLHAESELILKNAAVLWFNARIIAVAFYQKFGYMIIGGEFTIGDIGPHYVMYKHLK